MHDGTHWTPEDLQRFLEIRQEFFLDPMGSNKERFLEATTVLQRALFDWYLNSPGHFEGMLARVTAADERWSKLRKEERRTIPLRRFALNNASPDLPAVESSVSEHQWQKIFGSLGLGLSDPGTFDRFLVQLDEETNPSLRVNHRYLGELLPHDNMVSYLSSITATFLNENAIIGKVSPCVTHMEQAAVRWLISLVGWDGGFRTAGASLPVPRLPTLAPPAQRFLRWEREDPTGTVVAGGTIANISAMLIARNALFDYLLGWSGAVQRLGPILAWKAIQDIWSYQRLLVLTSKGAHYSIQKAAGVAGVAPGNVREIAGSKNPWILDRDGLQAELRKFEFRPGGDLLVCVAAIAGKTETGYVDKLAEIGCVLDEGSSLATGNYLPTLPEVLKRVTDKVDVIGNIIKTLSERQAASEAFEAARETWTGKDVGGLLTRVTEGSEVLGARHNRPFYHIDAAHGGAFLTVPSLRQKVFDGIELADTITLDGHKSFYCYYPCGGLLIRATRWAQQTFSSGHSAYISEDENRGVYREGLVFTRGLEKPEQELPTIDASFDRDKDGYRDRPDVNMDKLFRSTLDALYQLMRRPIAADQSELTHHPFNEYLEGSRGPQGIMQLYFNLATLGLRGYRSILGWTVLLRARVEEAVSLGMSDVRLVTDPSLPRPLYADDKLAAIQSSGDEPAAFDESRAVTRRQPATEPATVVPVLGGRFVRLSDGACNQLLISYLPAREAKLIATAPRAYWEALEPSGPAGIRRMMRYLWRINEHLWAGHIYANPHFTYYLGHTSLRLELPSKPDEERAQALGQLLTDWNAWAKQRDGRNAFFDVLAELVAVADRQNPGSPEPEDGLKAYTRKFFCHKIVIMHPYTDESLLGDMLRRLAFWGERSVTDVKIADATARFFFPDEPAPRRRLARRKARTPAARPRGKGSAG